MTPDKEGNWYYMGDSGFEPAKGNGKYTNDFPNLFVEPATGMLYDKSAPATAPAPAPPAMDATTGVPDTSGGADADCGGGTE